MNALPVGAPTARLRGCRQAVLPAPISELRFCLTALPISVRLPGNGVSGRKAAEIAAEHVHQSIIGHKFPRSRAWPLGNSRLIVTGNAAGVPPGRQTQARQVDRLHFEISVGRKILGRVAHLVCGSGTDIDAAAGPRRRPGIGLLKRHGPVGAGRRYVEPLAQTGRRFGSAMPCWLSGTPSAFEFGLSCGSNQPNGGSCEYQLPSGMHHLPSNPSNPPPDATDRSARCPEYRADPGACSGAA